MINKKVEGILKKIWPYLVFIVVAILLVSYQIQKHTTIVVADSYFHFSRFYDAAEQIKNHNLWFLRTFFCISNGWVTTSSKELV